MSVSQKAIIGLAAGVVFVVAIAIVVGFTSDRDTPIQGAFWGFVATDDSHGVAHLLFQNTSSPERRNHAECEFTLESPVGHVAQASFYIELDGTKIDERYEELEIPNAREFEADTHGRLDVTQWKYGVQCVPTEPRR